MPFSVFLLLPDLGGWGARSGSTCGWNHAFEGRSNCEAEYMTVFTATVECVWLIRLMADLGVGQDTANTIYTDSQSALAIARNPVFHARTKHIEVYYHYVRERLSAGEISLAYVPTQDNLADLFTKALSREKLEAFRKALGLLQFVD
ncbi:hypothetical protein L7F22_061410 [Adiantum nelumboides]|nr:hypothetical protein [Adiantum nelumboides]